MLPIEILIPFFGASILLGLAPGPDNIFVLTQSALRGRTAGMVVMLGLCTGLVGHSLAVAFGIAVIFQTSTLAFSILKYLGAFYLIYLSWQAFAASSTKIGKTPSSELSHWKLYRRGIIMNISNPKVSIFFLAFLPQFADLARGPIWIQLLILGGHFIIATILVFGSIALLAGTLGQWMNRSSQGQAILNKLTGVVFIGLALKLAMTER